MGLSGSSLTKDGGPAPHGGGCWNSWKPVRMRVGSGLGHWPKLSVDTKGSLFTSGQAQASAGSTPSHWLLGNQFAFGAWVRVPVERKHALFTSRMTNP